MTGSPANIWCMCRRAIAASADADADRAPRRRRRCRLPGRRFQVPVDLASPKQAGFIAVFPNGYSRFPSGILATWNAGSCCGGGAEEQCRRRRLHPRGHPSRRAPGEHRPEPHLRDRHVERRDDELAAGLRSTRGPRRSRRSRAPTTRPYCTPSRPVPVIEFHALDDDHVPFNGGAGVELAHHVDFTSVPATRRNGWQLDRAEPPGEARADRRGRALRPASGDRRAARRSNCA